MRIGPLSVTFHRTVRVAEGRTPANLPPSLGHIKTYDVSAFRERCPKTWEDAGIFLGLHETEALWMSFHAQRPVALLIGAGAINAINGKKLGTKLEAGNYIVAPPQPWLDGWKATDGTVYQFVATAYKGGKGNTVAEQLIGEESKTGGIGIALFESKEPLAPKGLPIEGSGDAYGDITHWKTPTFGTGSIQAGMSMETKCMASASASAEAPRSRLCSASRAGFSEMGLGKGGKIIQKVYDDPYGLSVWNELPAQTRAVYIVHAELLAEITGEPIPEPVSQGQYGGPWFGLQDGDHKDVSGTDAFTGLKSVFAEETEVVPTKVLT